MTRARRTTLGAMTDAVIAMWFITCSGCGWYGFTATFGWSDRARLLSALAAAAVAP